MSDDQISPRAGWRREAPGMLVLLGLAAVIGTRFSGFAFDDPFITYRIARNVTLGNGFVYNLGERVNAATSPLHALVLAGLHFVTRADFPLLGAAVSMVGLFFAGLFLARLFAQVREPGRGYLAGALVIGQPLLVQCLGMETGLLLALNLAAFWAYTRERWTLSGALFGLAALARLDALILAGCVLIYYCATRRKAPPLSALLAFGLALAPWLIFSEIFFDEFLPHTLAVKSAQGLVAGQWGGEWMFARVLYQIISSLLRFDVTGTLILACLLGGIIDVVISPRPWPRIILVWAVLHAVAYAVVLRVPPYTWYFAPVLVGLVMLLALGGARLAELAAARRGIRLAFCFFLIGGLVAFGVFSLLGSDLAKRFSPLNFGNLLGYAAMAAGAGLMSARALRNRRAIQTVAAAVIVVAAILPRSWNGFLQMTHVPTSQYLYYRAAADWIVRARPEAKSVGAHEIGVLGYYLFERRIIDQCGIPTPGAAEHLAAGDLTWWIREYRPELLLLHPAQAWWQAVEGPVRDAPWFEQAYRRVAILSGRDQTGAVIVASGDQTVTGAEKHAVEIWELIAPAAVPAP